MTYPCPLRVPPPRGLWLCKGSSKKSGHRGCFLAERTALLGRNMGLFSKLPRGCWGPETSVGYGVIIQSNPSNLTGRLRPEKERVLPMVSR